MFDKLVNVQKQKIKWTLGGLCAFYCMQILGDDIDHLSRDGFDRIIRKVIFKVGKVRFVPFSQMYQYYSVVTKCCPNFKVIEVHFVIYFGPISQKRCMLYDMHHACYLKS